MRNPDKTITWGAFALAFLPFPGAIAEVSLPRIFSDHMVLQRGEPVAVWGRGDAGEAVEVRFAGQKKSAKAGGDGSWKVELDAMEARAEGSVLTVSGKNTIEVADVLVGEVWVCSGQSNMQWTVANSKDAKGEIAGAHHPGIRMFLTDLVTAAEPANDVGGVWKVCSPEDAGAFSAVAYYFGRELHGELGVPVGLIRTAWGGTRVEAWTGRGALEAAPAARRMLEDWENYARGFDLEAAKARYEVALAKWQEAVAKIREENAAHPERAKRPFPRRPEVPVDARLDRHHPSVLYNAMVAPFVGYGIKGAIWYQGESNRERAAQYRELFPALISDWRDRWNKEFPFYFVQLANFQEPGTAPGVPDIWAELQDAQTLTLKRLPHTGMAVANDIGEAEDIHPKNKQEVGRRLALWALAKDYGKVDLVYSGPIYAGHEIEGGKVRVAFEHVGGGLKARDGGPLKRFEIAGEDRVWRWAEAEIDGDEVVVSGREVPAPVAVRYAWASNPEGANLVNAEGLPAPLFRTDDWESKTDGVMSPFGGGRGR